ncbi:MAG: nicotinamide riboside transporter PnuC [Verrucomicrobiales bacterium]
MLTAHCKSSFLLYSGCALLLLSALTGWLPLDPTEAFGFATGAICVWLITRGNIWNWPVGLANNIFFAILFWQTRLYADFGLQAVYFALGCYGWWHWLNGGDKRDQLPVTHARKLEWILAASFLILGTWGLRELLIAVNGAAPFWDALTTILCLIAQYLLCRKRLGNWYFWIAADLIYVPLYLSRGLPLIAFLYFIFLLLCLLGIRNWRKELHSS